jgi:hypothetical protein
MTESNYVPVVASLEDVTPIPGADRIISASARGYHLVVGANHKAGELGVVFPAEGVLDLQFALAAGLLMKHPLTGAKLDGYLADPPRIRNLTLRGVRTEALWLPLADFCAAVERAVRSPTRPGNEGFAVLANLPAPVLPDYKDGDEIGPIELMPGALAHVDPPDYFVVARKYMPPVAADWRKPDDHTPRSSGPLTRAQRAAAKVRAAQQAAERLARQALPEHYNTPPAHRAAYHLPPGAVVWATDKLHGTSGRDGIVSVPSTLSPWKRAINRIAAIVKRQPFDAHVRVNGTRRVTRIVRPLRPDQTPDMRRDISDWLAPRLRVGECVYYEIVGFDHGGKPIQKQRVSASKGGETATLRAAWGDEIVYAYGCAPDGVPIKPGHPYPHAANLAQKPQQRVFIYRITQDGLELPFENMRKRVAEIGAESPPLLGSWQHAPSMTKAIGDDAHDVYANGKSEDEAAFVRDATRETMRRARDLAEGIARPPAGVPSSLDPTHPLEGVVLRADHGTHLGTTHVVCKLKSHAFGVLEGYAKDRGEVDPEEVDGTSPDAE